MTMRPSSPEDQRLSRSHRDAPEPQLHAAAGKRRLHEVMIAYRGSPERDEHVGTCVLRPDDRLFKRAEFVGSDPEVQHLSTGLLDHAANSEGVGCHDLVGPHGLSRPHQFVPGSKHGHERFAPDIHLRVSHCRCQRNRTRVQALTGCEQLLARCEIQSSRSDMAALPLAVEHGDVSASRFRILLNDDGIGAARQRRSGEDADCLAGSYFTGEGMPGRSRADHLKHRARVLDVSRANGVAIHGRGIEGRLRPQC